MASVHSLVVEPADSFPPICDGARAAPVLAPGLVVVSPAALELLCSRKLRTVDLVRAHVRGLWPAVSAAKRERMVAAMRAGILVEGRFMLGGATPASVSVCTDAQLRITYVLLPVEAERLF